MNFNGTTFFLSYLSPPVSAGPQKPQTLTAWKTKYENFGPKMKSQDDKDFCRRVQNYQAKFGLVMPQINHLEARGASSRTRGTSVDVF